MAQRVYIETTIPSYLTAWPSRDVVRAGHQQLTRQWWETRRTDFDLVVSQLVLDECAAGDLDAANARLAELKGVPVLAATQAVTMLAAAIASDLSLPAKAVNDAVHIAIAAVHGVEYLLTWNCAHIANAAFRGRIEAACSARGFCAPVIATPEQLLRECQMWGDKVLEEVRAVREAHAARFGFDLQAIIEDLRRREAMSGHPVIQPGNSREAANTAPVQPLHSPPSKVGTLVS